MKYSELNHRISETLFGINLKEWFGIFCHLIYIIMRNAKQMTSGSSYSPTVLRLIQGGK